MASAHVAALECEAIHHGAFLVTADSPLARIEPLRFFADRRGCLEELYPGIGEYIEAGSVEPARIDEWYTIERARNVLGWEPERNFKLPEES
ncbi:MAG: hypothetical protein ACOCX2_13745 [Armatimonadota bacterium]